MNACSLLCKLRLYAVVLLSIVMVIGIPCPGKAQKLKFESTAAALAAPVHLRLGTTTLKHALKSLSDQTGILG